MDSVLPRCNESLLSDSQVWIFVSSKLRASSTSVLSFPDISSAESSANRNNLQLQAVFMSFIYNKNSKGPSMLQSSINHAAVTMGEMIVDTVARYF